MLWIWITIALAADPATSAKQQATTAADALMNQLKSRLVGELKTNGPPSALSVCTAEAQVTTATLGAEHGVRVGRASTRLRNPANGGPDWVQAWLATAPAKAADAKPFTRIDTLEDGSKVARHLRPLGIAEPCLNCHGPSDRISAEVRALLAKHYPSDHATGYAVGDLRGALWAEAAVK